MPKDIEVLAVIPARGGSKKVPRKNIKLLGGKPLIGYTLEAAQQARLINRILVSTDSREIASVVEDFGPPVPFLRPPELAQDDTPDYPVFRHALDWLAANEDYRPDIVVNLRPTSPFRRPGDIDGAIGTLIQKKADTVKSVCEAAHHPHKMWRRDEEGILSPYLVTPLHLTHGSDVPRQWLEPVYQSNGAVDASWVRLIYEQEKLVGERVVGYVMPERFSLDLDTPWDFMVAEALLPHILAERSEQ